MLQSYNDIKDLIDKEPLWYDNHGVPRYRPFTPIMLGVYDKYAVLAEIACQNCGHEFHVGDGVTGATWVAGEVRINSLADLVNGYHYGDPPSHGCVGDTMNSICYRVLEAWEHTKATNWEWRRFTEYEGFIKYPDGDWRIDWIGRYTNRKNK